MVSEAELKVRRELREQEKRRRAELAALQRVHGTGSWPVTPSTGRVLYNANSGMAHLQSQVAELQPVCPHFDQKKKDGWRVTDWEWSRLPDGVDRCQTCAA